MEEFKVNVTDEGLDDDWERFFQKLHLIAIAFTSYKGYDVVDVSDVSGRWDLIAEYTFTDIKEQRDFKEFTKRAKLLWST